MTSNALHVPNSLAEVVRRFAPPGFAAPLTADLAIAPGGLDFDSVALVELLLACEERFRVPFPDTLLERPPLTIGRLVEHLAANGIDADAIQ